MLSSLMRSQRYARLLAWTLNVNVNLATQRSLKNSVDVRLWAMLGTFCSRKFGRKNFQRTNIFHVSPHTAASRRFGAADPLFGTCQGCVCTSFGWESQTLCSRYFIQHLLKLSVHPLWLRFADLVQQTLYSASPKTECVPHLVEKTWHTWWKFTRIDWSSVRCFQISRNPSIKPQISSSSYWAHFSESLPADLVVVFMQNLRNVANFNTHATDEVLLFSFRLLMFDALFGQNSAGSFKEKVASAPARGTVLLSPSIVTFMTEPSRGDPNQVMLFFLKVETQIW